MNFKPLYDNVLIKRVEAQNQTNSGLYIPSSAQEKPQQATVIETGPGKTDKDGNHHSLAVNKGDTVLFGKYSGHELTLEGEDYIILKETDILAIVS
jgi:chaperonin GroES